jgi:hypothetical protein
MPAGDSSDGMPCACASWRKEYRGRPDDVTFFKTEPRGVFHLHSSAQSQPYFRELSALIDMPGKFKRRTSTDA